MSRLGRDFLKPVGQLLVALVVAAGLAYFVFDHSLFSEVREASETRPFDRNEWLEHADPDERQNPRWQMVVDLTRVLRSEPRSREEVIALLGPPTMERGNSLYYAIGW